MPAALHQHRRCSARCWPGRWRPRRPGWRWQSCRHPGDDAVEATGRAIALETEANPERSPTVRSPASRVAPLPPPPAGRHGPGTAGGQAPARSRLRAAALDRSPWVCRNAVPPRSAWRVYEPRPTPARLLASLLLFGRQTDRDPEAVLQGFGPDRGGCRRSSRCCSRTAGDLAAMPASPRPTGCSAASFGRPRRRSLPQSRRPLGSSTRPWSSSRKPSGSALPRSGPTRRCPSCSASTPREAVGDAEGSRGWRRADERGRRPRPPDATAGWAASQRPGPAARAARSSRLRRVEELPPLRWHRVELAPCPRPAAGLLETAIDAGLRAGRRCGRPTRCSPGPSRPTPAQSPLTVARVSFQRAETTTEKLEIIGQLRQSPRRSRRARDARRGRTAGAPCSGAMRSEAADADQLRSGHGSDRRVLQAVAEC